MYPFVDAMSGKNTAMLKNKSKCFAAPTSSCLVQVAEEEPFTSCSIHAVPQQKNCWVSVWLFSNVISPERQQQKQKQQKQEQQKQGTMLVHKPSDKPEGKSVFASAGLWHLDKMEEYWTN